MFCHAPLSKYIMKVPWSYELLEVEGPDKSLL